VWGRVTREGEVVVKYDGEEEEQHERLDVDGVQVRDRKMGFGCYYLCVGV